jgi:hypothetical protein
MSIESSTTPLTQNNSQDEEAKEAYLQNLEKLNDQLSTYDSISANARSGKELTEEEKTFLNNPGEDVKSLLDERAELIRENYRFHELVSAATEASDTYKHIASHLEGGFGSNFNKSEVFPEGMDVVQFGEEVLEKAYKGGLEGETVVVNGKEGRLSWVEGSEGGRVVVKVEFEDAIGTNALVDISSVEGVVDIADGELEDEIKQRYAGTQIAPSAKKQPTNTMFVIGGPYGPTGKFGLYTVYCGEYAPPAPSARSSEAELAFWRTKAWATQE